MISITYNHAGGNIAQLEAHRLFTHYHQQVCYLLSVSVLEWTSLMGIRLQLYEDFVAEILIGNNNPDVIITEQVLKC